MYYNLSTLIMIWVKSVWKKRFGFTDYRVKYHSEISSFGNFDSRKIPIIPLSSQHIIFLFIFMRFVVFKL